MRRAVTIVPRRANQLFKRRTFYTNQFMYKWNETVEPERLVEEQEKTYNLYHEHPVVDHIGYAPEDDAAPVKGESFFDKDKRSDLKDYPSGQPYQQTTTDRVVDKKDNM